jgi:uncharacterized damage-inducible protein DinB
MFSFGFWRLASGLLYFREEERTKSPGPRMTLTELQDLFEYNRWAHENILHAAAGLAPDEYNAASGNGASSPRAALQSTLAEEVAWLSRWEGHSLAEPPDYSECVNTEALLTRWKSLWGRQRRFLESLNEDELSRFVSVRLPNGIEAVQPLGDTMMHMVNHSTYLRGQAATLIAQLGGNIPDSDYFTYCTIRGPDGTEEDAAP